MVMGLEKTGGYTSGEHFTSEIVTSLEKSQWGVRKPVPLLFYLYLPNQEAANSCVAPIKAVGLEVTVEESAGGDGKWLCLGKAKLVPDEARLTEIGTVLFELAKEKGGELDGWETDVVAAAKKGCLRIVVRLLIVFVVILAVTWWLIKRIL